MSELPHDRKRTAGRVGASIGGAIGGAVDATFDVVGNMSKLLLSPLRMPSMGSSLSPQRHVKPGAPPGIESEPDLNTPPEPGTFRITCIDYSPDQVETRTISDLESFLASDRPQWVTVRWINIDGLHPYIVNQFMKTFGLHTLAAEDVLHVPQRPKLEPFDNELFLITRMLNIHDGQLAAEQVSYFYRPDLLITFQERQGDVWQPIRVRLENKSSRLRTQDASYLLYALLDAVVDQCFPILEHYGDALEEMEVAITTNLKPDTLRLLHGMKRQLVQLRRVMWPMRELMSALSNEDLESISGTTRTYLRDVQDHTIRVIDIIETYREMAGGLTDLYMSVISNRMNEVMKVLTIIASLFIPITFIAGVYGMNFDPPMPELQVPWMYPYGFWALCFVCVVSMLYYFRKKGWLGQ